MNESTVNPDDFDTSLRLLLCLAAGYQGSYVAQEILLAISHPSNPISALKFNKRMLDSIYLWNELLVFKDIPLIRTSWTQPESEDLQLAFRMLDNLIVELREVYDLSKLITASPLEELSEAEFGWCVAQLGRFAYGLDHYYKVLNIYAKQHNVNEVIETCNESITNNNPKLFLLGKVVNNLKNGYRDEQLTGIIIEESKTLPRAALVCLHDCLLYFNLYAPHYTFEMFGIGENQAKLWQEAGFDPLLSNFWIAYGFTTPKEVTEWTSYGFDTPQIAALWHDTDITPAEAIEWIKLEVTPIAAYEWRKAGFSHSKAKVYIDKGMKLPPQARKNLKNN